MELMAQEMELNSAFGNGREQRPEREAPAEVTMLDSQGYGHRSCGTGTSCPFCHPKETF